MKYTVLVERYTLKQIMKLDIEKIFISKAEFKHPRLPFSNRYNL
jgi:hypothetical protein